MLADKCCIISSIFFGVIFVAAGVSAGRQFHGWQKDNQQNSPVEQHLHREPDIHPEPTSKNSELNYEFKHERMLNEAKGETLEWEVDWNSKTIIFTISAPTEGYVALGLSRSGQVEDADVVVGGVRSNGQTYIMDMHGVGDHTTARDASQNWRLVSVLTTRGKTTMKVSREVDTCDGQDIVINDDVIHIIWDYGDTTDPKDDIPFQFIPRGDFRAYLLAPRATPPEKDIQTWRFSREFSIPKRRTSYWCSIHRAISLRDKHHIVGYSPYFKNEVSRKHVHHQLIYRCLTPPGVNASQIFERFVDHPGEECYLEDNHELPTFFCAEIMHMWGLGGEPFDFPSDVGFPIGGEDEYIMYEVHYNREDNEIEDDIIVESGVDFRYTPKIRPEEGGIFLMGYGVLGLMMIPPRETSFNVAGHCSSDCLQSVMPPTGMKVVATNLHAHTTTTKMRTKHFRGDEELAWIDSDDNFAYDYQQWRLLREPRAIQPGDRLSTECAMDTRGRGAVSLAGFSTRDEMCVTFVMVDKRIPLYYCASEVPAGWYLERYGIRNITWDRHLAELVVNSADDPALVGLTLAQTINLKEAWTSQARREVEKRQFLGVHEGACGNHREIAFQAYAALYLVGGSAAEEVNNNRISTRTVGGPMSQNNITFPSVASVYSPPNVCHGHE